MDEINISPALDMFVPGQTIKIEPKRPFKRVKDNDAWKEPSNLFGDFF